MARPGTMAAQQEQPVFNVPSIMDMNVGDALSHCRARHRHLRFVTKGEHEAQHRLYPEQCTDHVHANHVADEVENVVAEIEAFDVEAGEAEKPIPRAPKRGAR
jgi:hypothetical protein